MITPDITTSEHRPTRTIVRTTGPAIGACLVVGLAVEGLIGLSLARPGRPLGVPDALTALGGAGAGAVVAGLYVLARLAAGDQARALVGMLQSAVVVVSALAALGLLWVVGFDALSLTEAVVALIPLLGVLARRASDHPAVGGDGWG